MKRPSLVFRHQVTPFVVLFVERAGSTYLITALKSHPGVLALTEKLEALRREGLGSAAQLRWASEFLTPPLIGRHVAIGFKTKLVDVIDQDGFAQLLRERRCRIIQLQRRNAVKAVISTINARRQWEVSGNWNLLNESTRLPAFEVNPDQFDDLLQQRVRLDRDLEDYVEELRLPTLRLYYEDLLQDESAFLDRALGFLTGKRRVLRGATLKNTGDDLRGAIVNFDQLRTLYAGTPYEPMFDEVLTTT
jgi:hypothetical protein